MFAKQSEMFCLVDKNCLWKFMKNWMHERVESHSFCDNSYSSFKKIKQMWINSSQIQIPFY